MTQPVGEAFVTILPDTKGFAAALKTEVTAAVAGLNTSLKATSSTGSSAFSGIGSSAKGATGSVSALSGAIKKFDESLKDAPFEAFKAGLTGIKIGLEAIVATSAAVSIGSIFAGLKGASDVESLRIRFTALRSELDIGKQSVDDFVDGLRDLAVKVGIDSKVLGDGVARFVTLGLNAKQATAFTLGLGDALAASGLKGGSLAQALQTVQTQLSQSAGSGKLAGDELRSVLETLGGVITRAELIAQVAKDTGRSVADVSKDVNNGALKASDGLQALFELTQKKSIAGALEKQSHTLGGVFARIKGTIQNGLTDAFLPTIDKVAGELEAFLGQNKSKFDAFGKSLAASFNDALPAILSLATDVLPRIPAIFAGISSAAVAVAPLIGKAFEGVQGAIDAIQGADLSGAFQSLANLAPLASGLAQGLGAVAIALVNILGALKPVTALFSGPFGHALGQVIGLSTGFFLVAKGALALRAAIIAIGVALDLTPIGAVVTVVVLLGAAFVKAYTSSQKFRDVVNGVFNTIAKTAGTALKFVVDGLVEFELVGLRVIQGLLEGAGHLPNWLGGGKFDAAAGAVQKIIDGVEGVKRKFNELVDAGVRGIHINVAADRARAQVADLGNRIAALSELTPVVKVVVELDNLVGQQNSALLSGKLNSKFNAGAKTGLEDASGFDPRLFGEIGKKATKVVSDGVKNVGDSLAGSGGAAVADGAASAAKAALTKLKNALTAANKAVNDIAKHTSDQTVDQIRTSFDALKKGLADAGLKSYIAQVNGVERQLIKLAKQRDVLSNKLKDATSDLQKLKDEQKDYAASVRDTVDSLGSVAQATQGIGTTFIGIRQQLIGAIGTTRQFSQAIQALTAEGLNNTSLKQLVDAGPAQGLAAANALLAGGVTGVKQINELQSQLDAQGKALGISASHTFLDAGIAAGQALVVGLQSQEGAIEKQMDRIANKLTKAIKKALEMHSPSRLLAREVGKPAAQGIIQGLMAEIGNVGGVASSVRNVANNVTFGPGSIVAHGATEASANRMGTGIGLGISDVVERQLAQARLGGVA